MLKILPVALCLLVAGQAGAVELVWGINDPFETNDVFEVELGTTLIGVQSVQIRAEGVGGRQGYSCTRYPGDSGTTYKFLDLHFAVPDGETEGLAVASCATMYPEPYDQTVTAEPAVGHEDWGFLADGVFTITKSAHAGEYPYPYPWCYGILPNESPTVEHLELIITVDSYVPAAKTTWGTLKAVYR